MSAGQPVAPRTTPEEAERRARRRIDHAMFCLWMSIAFLLWLLLLLAPWYADQFLRMMVR